jgi:hypothetical protein
VDSSPAYWPASVPRTLWQFGLLVPENRRDFPFVGIAISWQFLAAFLAGTALICAFAWRRFSEPAYDVNTAAFRDFKQLTIWNLKDSASLRRAYLVYCISLVFIYVALAFFGRVIFQLASQLNVSGLEVSVGTIDFDSWKWPLALALGISGFAPLINPLIPAEHLLRRFAHEVVGIPTRVREKAVRLKTLIDGTPFDVGDEVLKTSDWVKVLLGSKLRASFVLHNNLKSVVDWSYREHITWSDPDIRGKLNEYERQVREDAEGALADFEYLTDAEKVPDAIMRTHNARLKEYEKRLSDNILQLEELRDKFSVILAIYCEYGSRFEKMTDAPLRKSIVNSLIDDHDPGGTGLPLYLFIVIFVIYYIFVMIQWHPLISSVPLSTPNIAITAAIETLKVFLLIWLPLMAVATFTSVIYGSERKKPSGKEPTVWEVVSGMVAALTVSAVGMALFAIIYSALPASSIAQMQQILLGSGAWTAALIYYLLLVPVSGFCFFFAMLARAPSRRRSFGMILAPAMAAALLTLVYLGMVASLTAPTDGCMRIIGNSKAPAPVSVPGVFAAKGMDIDDVQTCFAYYSSLDILVISGATFVSVLGLSRLRHSGRR